MKPYDRTSPATAGWRVMTTCPRYTRCSVPICPLDPDWDLRTHDNEAVCPFLRESARGTEARYVGRPDEHCLAAAIKLRPAIEAKHPSIAYQIAASAGGTSLLDQAEATAAQLRRAKKGAGQHVSTVSPPED